MLTTGRTYGPKGDALRRAILRLPKYERLVIMLRYFEDLNDPQVAQVLELDVPTVTLLRERGVRRIREAMDR